MESVSRTAMTVSALSLKELAALSDGMCMERQLSETERNEE